MKSITYSLLLLCLLSTGAHAESLRLAVAANFAYPLEQLVQAFDPNGLQDIRISTASTGVLYAQIRQGAPFDIFFAADRERPTRLEQEGYALQGSRQTYAIGQLALWQPRETPSSLSAIRPGRLAIANPKTAPYGQAARELLSANGLWSRVKPVQGTNIAQAFQFVDSGNVDQGLVAVSLLLQRSVPARQWTRLPDTQHAPIEQQLVRLTPSRDNALADTFMRFLSSQEARTLIRQYGYEVPHGTD